LFAHIVAFFYIIILFNVFIDSGFGGKRCFLPTCKDTKKSLHLQEKSLVSLPLARQKSVNLVDNSLRGRGGGPCPAGRNLGNLINYFPPPAG
jgi:hypothetical protein